MDIMFKMKIISLSHLILATLLLIPTSSWAQNNFVEPEDFLVSDECSAYSSIRKQSNESRLKIGKHYKAYAENKANNATHALIDVAGKRKWVSLACGNYPHGKPAFRDTSQTTAKPKECLPFFDNSNATVRVSKGGTVDITPKPPKLEPFGVAVNQICGPAGKVTHREEFKQLMLNHQEVLNSLMKFTQGKVFAKRSPHSNTDDYLEDLMEAWYQNDGFDHIFCGEPKSAKKIGGLHYHGRYLQLQESGEACRLPNHHQNEVVPGVIYTMGVKMKRANGGWAKFNYKGYGLTMSAADILMAVTKAFAENPSNRKSDGCLLKIRDDGANFTAVFYRGSQGIRTFYPDATPGRGKRCANSITLN